MSSTTLLITLAIISILLIGGLVYLSKLKNTSLAFKRAITGYSFIVPWLIGFFMLVVIPLGRVIYMSFQNVKPKDGIYHYQFIGFGNFERILRVDLDFVLHAQNYVVKVLLYTPVIITLAIVIALLLNQNIKGKGFFRMVFFLPIIILNGKLLENMSQYGGMDISLNRFVYDLLAVVVPEFAFESVLGLFGYIIEILWYTGVPILIFLALLQKVDKSLFEAAAIDGADAWSTFWKITLPAIWPGVSVAVIFIVVFLANFDGNPINAFINTSMSASDKSEGYAAAVALLYAFLQLVLIGILLFITIPRERRRT